MNFETFKDLTRIEQTLFGLPFVISGALLAILNYAFSWVSFLWIFPAFLLARISGMAFNQLIDRFIDAQNPRTKNRALPSGRVSPLQAKIVAFGSLGLFIVVCWKINLFCFLLSPCAAFLLIFYSYMKRIHASCHIVLGIIHFLGPVMAFIAISGTCSWSVVFLGLVSSFSIIGNDIAYAIQDYHFDCAHRLHSIPSRFGVEKSLRISWLFHVGSLASLILVGILGHLPILYYLAVIAVGITFTHFHSTVKRQYQKTKSVKGIESVFFFSNVLVSSSAFFFILLSVLWAVLL